MAKKKKPKVVLKKKQVIILASTIVALCTCMLTVTILTAPNANTPKNLQSSSGEIFSASQTSDTTNEIDDGVAQVIAQLEEAEDRAKEAERRAREAEKRASSAELAAENASKKAQDLLATQKKALEKANQSQQKLDTGTPPPVSSSNSLALGNKDGSSHPLPSGTKKDYTIPPARAGATLVFVLDDGGQNLADLQHYLNLPFPIDIAVLPQLEQSKESARRIRASGRHELLLHQPMQAKNLSVNPGPGAITPTMTTTEIETLVKKNLAEIGPVAGMNNHEGSLISESKVKIGKVIEICQQQGIFFLDSRTSAATAAPQVALELGSHIWERDVFLDNTQSRADILQQLERGLGVANKKGYAIMIGHVWSGSNLAQILQELYPVLKAQGYSFSTVGGLYENFGS